MIRKCLVIGIIILFVGTIIPSVTPEQTYVQNIITVDDEPGDADFTSITEALTYANPGDIIEVYSGKYLEHLITISTNRISLIGLPYELGAGNDTGKPFIGGQSFHYVINIQADNVTVTGFTIENPFSDNISNYYVIEIYWGSDGCVISNNDLKYSVLSTLFCRGNFSSIVNNTIYATFNQGIDVANYYNRVINNTITHCDWGIYSRGRYSSIIGNKISKCSGSGISVIHSNTNTLQRNLISNCYYGIALEKSDCNIFQLNTMRNCTWSFKIDGIRNTIEKNNFLDDNNQTIYYGRNFRNHWNQNYWSSPRSRPYPIRIPNFFNFPIYQFDWHPAQVPYDIPGMR